MQTSAPITYSVRRNVGATRDGRPARIALCLILFPDGKGMKLGIDEDELATIPDDALDDFIANEVETLIGYQVTRTH